MLCQNQKACETLNEGSWPSVQMAWTVGTISLLRQRLPVIQSASVRSMLPHSATWLASQMRLLSTVVYEVLTTGDEVFKIDNPAKLPPANEIAEIREPIIVAHILTPQDYLGAIITLCIEKRGAQRNIHYAGGQVQLSFELPMSEVVMDFFDRLKSVSRGFASFEYSFERFQAAPLVKLDVLINGERVDSLSAIVHREQAQRRGHDLAVKLKQLIPQQMFEVAIQAAIGSQIIARTTVKALRKNVLAKCYGGDVSRKRKLLEKQKAGKKRMKQVGRVEIPQSAFLAVLKMDS